MERFLGFHSAIQRKKQILRPVLSPPCAHSPPTRQPIARVGCPRYRGFTGFFCVPVCLFGPSCLCTLLPSLLLFSSFLSPSLTFSLSQLFSPFLRHSLLSPPFLHSLMGATFCIHPSIHPSIPSSLPHSSHFGHLPIHSLSPHLV